MEERFGGGGGGGGGDHHQVVSLMIASCIGLLIALVGSKISRVLFKSQLLRAPIKQPPYQIPRKFDKTRSTAIFIHFRKCGGTSIVHSLADAGSVKFPSFHKNGNPWQQTDLHSRLVRFWDFDEKTMKKWLAQISNEGISIFACEWGIPKFFFSTKDHSFEIFASLRDPFARFKSEFEFLDNFFVDVNYPTPSPNPRLIQEQRKGVKASEWIKTSLYWLRDDSTPFRVSINRPNFYVRMLCSLSTQPDLVLDSHHLEYAKQLLDRFVAVVILEDPNSHKLLKRWGMYGSVLPKVLGRGSMMLKDKDSLMDISEADFNRMNSLDVELFKYARSLSHARIAQYEASSALQQSSSSSSSNSSSSSPSFFKMRSSSKEKAHDRIMAETDIVIPLKRRGVIFRAVLGAIHKFYRPRRIIVISGKPEISWLKSQLPKWQSLQEVGNIEFVDEEMIFFPLYGYSRTSLKAFFEESCAKLREKPLEQRLNLNTIGEREFGWWYQQLLKIGAGLLLELSPTYFVWDADLIPLKRWDLCTLDPKDGVTPKFITAVLQLEAKSPALANEYATCTEKLLGLDVARPDGGGTFVTHHMAIHQNTCTEMLNLIESRRGCPWPKAILGIATECTRFSEYIAYSTFTISKDPTSFTYHKVNEFGIGGVRMRGGLHIVNALVTSRDIQGHHDVYGGFSYEAFCNFANGYFTHGIPPYVQLDHVYVAPHQNPLAPLYPPPSSEITIPSQQSSSSSSSSKHVKILLQNSSELLLQQQQGGGGGGNGGENTVTKIATNNNINNSKLWDYTRSYVYGGNSMNAQHINDVSEDVDMQMIDHRFAKLRKREAMWWDKFKEKGCIFIHIPKNAGTSVESLYLGPEAPPSSQHFTARELRKQNPEDFGKLLKFCVVRNPYDRLLSAYMYLKSGGNNKPGSDDLFWRDEIAKFPTFAKFIESLFPEVRGSRIPDWRNSVFPTHFIPQHIFVCGNRRDGYRLLVDKVVYMSDLIRNASNALNECNIPLLPSTTNNNSTSSKSNAFKLPHLRKSSPRDIGYDATTARIVYEVYRRDFELFGFRKESWKRWYA